MQPNQSQTVNLTNTQASPIRQEITPDYTGIYAFCGTVFLISIITLIVIHKISEKWRMDAYKLKIEEIKQNVLAMKDLTGNLKNVKLLLERLLDNGSNNTIDN